MKQVIFFILAILPSFLFSQVRPDHFTEETSPDSSNFEVYSQKNGTPRRGNLWNLKKYYVPGVNVTPIGYVPPATGNTANLTELVQTAGDSIFYIDGAGNALLLFDPNQLQTLSASNDTIFLTSGGFVVVVSSLANLTDVDTTGLDSLDYLQWNGSAWVPAAVTLPANLVSGTGSAGDLSYWNTDTTLSNANIAYTSTVLDMSGLTGALVLPSGTDAEDPVWANGMLRYNTTTNGIQGYNGSEKYLPWADAASWTSGYIPYSNGSRLTASSGLYFDSGGGELRLGGTADNGDYDFQLNGSGIYIKGAFPAIKINTGGIEFGSTQYTSLIFGTTSVNSSLISLENTSAASANAMGMKIISARPSLIGSGGANNSSYTALLISTRKNGADPGGDFNNIAETLRITTESSLDEDPTNGYGMKVGGGLAIDWNYKTNAGTDYRWKAGRIVPMVINSDANNLEDTELGFYASVNKVLTKIMALDSAGVKLPLYASGALTGTPNVQSASFNSNGRIISRKFAYGEMYIDDTDPDTISITSVVPAKGSDWTAGELANFTYSAGRLTYTGTETAKFLINTSISFSFGASSQTVEGWIYKTGAEVAKSEFHKKIVTATEVGQAGQTCIVELSTNDYIELYFDATSSNDLIVQNANVNLIKI